MVEWLDSATPAGGKYWHEKGARARIAKCRTVGWVVYAGKTALAVTQTQSKDQNGGLITIPRIAITKTKRLEGGEGHGEQANVVT